MNTQVCSVRSDILSVTINGTHCCVSMAMVATRTPNSVTLHEHAYLTGLSLTRTT